MGLHSFSKKSDKIENKLKSSVLLQYLDKNICAEAVWDTGATITGISHKVVSALSMTPSGSIWISTPSGRKIVNTYVLSILLPGKILMRDLRVAETEIGSMGIDVLLGMDVIRYGDFAISNYEDKTYFTFRAPSINHADFDGLDEPINDEIVLE